MVGIGIKGITQPTAGWFNRPDLGRLGTGRGVDWNNRLVTRQSAREVAVASAAAVRDDPGGRLALMRNQYRVPPDVDRGYLP